LKAFSESVFKNNDGCTERHKGIRLCGMTGARTNLQDELKIFIRKRADKRVQQLQKNKIRQEEYHEGNYGDV